MSKEPQATRRNVQLARLYYIMLGKQGGTVRWAELTPEEQERAAGAAGGLTDFVTGLVDSKQRPSAGRIATAIGLVNSDLDAGLLDERIKHEESKLVLRERAPGV